MSLDLRYVQCDQCNRGFSEGDEIYCYKCYNDLLEKVEDLEKEIGELKTQIEKMEATS